MDRALDRAWSRATPGILGDVKLALIEAGVVEVWASEVASAFVSIARYWDEDQDEPLPDVAAAVWRARIGCPGAGLPVAYHGELPSPDRVPELVRVMCEALRSSIASRLVVRAETSALTVKLSGRGAKARIVPVEDFAEASRLCRAFIEEHDLGSSAWTGGQIRDASGADVARVSYNGRVWSPGPWTPQSVALL